MMNSPYGQGRPQMPESPDPRPMNQPQGLGGLGATPRREGYFNYLQGQGYTGEMGPDMRAYAQTLRDQGQHPFMDYRQSAGFPTGQHGVMGQLPQHQWNPQQMPQVGSGYGMGGGMGMGYGFGQGRPPQGVAVGEPNGMASLSRRIPVRGQI